MPNRRPTTPPAVQPGPAEAAGPDDRAPGYTGSPARLAILYTLALHPLGLPLDQVTARVNLRLENAGQPYLAPSDVRRLLRVLADTGLVSQQQPTTGPQAEPLWYSPAARQVADMRAAQQRANRMASILRDHQSVVAP